MGTKNNPGKFDCYANADPDEPMFVLLGRDRHAPTLIWLWAALRELDQEDPEIVAEARDCLCKIIEWQSDHGKQAVGLGAAALAGVLELIRAANFKADGLMDAKNVPTTEDFVRLCLSKFKV